MPLKRQLFHRIKDVIIFYVCCDISLLSLQLLTECGDELSVKLVNLWYLESLSNFFRW